MVFAGRHGMTGAIQVKIMDGALRDLLLVNAEHPVIVALDDAILGVLAEGSERRDELEQVLAIGQLAQSKVHDDGHGDVDGRRVLVVRPDFLHDGGHGPLLSHTAVHGRAVVTAAPRLSVRIVRRRVVGGLLESSRPVHTMPEQGREH